MRHERHQKSPIFYLILPAIILGGLILIILLVILRTSKWNGDNRFTVVMNSNPILIFSIEPRMKRAVIVSLPANTIMDVPYGYSTYPASSVYYLGQLDSGRGGGKLLSGSIETTLGVPVDGYFAKKDNTFPVSESTELINYKKKYFSIPGAIFSLKRLLGWQRQFKTNISIIDKIRLWFAIRDIRSDKIFVINLQKTNALIADKLPDNTPIYNINKDLLDAILDSEFQDQLIRAQNVSIEIVNATNKERVAGQFGRILTSLGANVIMKTTAQDYIPNACLIYIAKINLKESYIIQKLTKHYQCRLADQSDTPSQADIKIVLGEDFLK